MDVNACSRHRVKMGDYKREGNVLKTFFFKKHIILFIFWIDGFIFYQNVTALLKILSNWSISEEKKTKVLNVFSIWHFGTNDKKLEHPNFVLKIKFW